MLLEEKAAWHLVDYGEQLAKAMDLPPLWVQRHGYDRLVDHARQLREQLTKMSAAWLSMPDHEIARCVDEWKAVQQAEVS